VHPALPTIMAAKNAETINFFINPSPEKWKSFSCSIRLGQRERNTLLKNILIFL